MSDSIHERTRAITLLLNADHITLRPEFRHDLEARVTAEQARYEGRTLDIARQRNLSIIDKIALMSASHSTLWRFRQRLGTAASGWRGR